MIVILKYKLIQSSELKWNGLVFLTLLGLGDPKRVDLFVCSEYEQITNRHRLRNLSNEDQLKYLEVKRADLIATQHQKQLKTRETAQAISIIDRTA